MNATAQLQALGAEYQTQLAAIRQMTLTEWQALAADLGVARNDREHAAKKLAIRALKTSGRL